MRAVFVFALIVISPLGLLVGGASFALMWQEEPALLIGGLIAGIALYFPLRALERWAEGDLPG